MQRAPRLGAAVARLARRGGLQVPHAPCNGWAKHHLSTADFRSGSQTTTAANNTINGEDGAGAASGGPRPLRVLFFGSGDFAVDTLHELAKSARGEGSHPGLVQQLEVVSPSPKPHRGVLTGCPVWRAAAELELVTHEVPPELHTLKAWGPGVPPASFDIGVVASFGYMLHAKTLDPLRLGAINIHPSLLPKYRGPCPLEHTLLNGDTNTGVALIRIDPKHIDVGAVVSLTEAKVDPADTYETLSTRLASQGARDVMSLLASPSLEQALTNAQPQNDAVASYAPFLAPQTANVRWELTTARRLYNECRARRTTGPGVLHTRLPAADASHAPIIVRITGVALPTPGHQPVMATPPADPAETGVMPVVLARASFKPGQVHYDRHGGALWVRCIDSWAQVTGVAIPARKHLTVADFANGFLRVPPAKGGPHVFEYVADE